MKTLSGSGNVDALCSPHAGVALPESLRYEMERLFCVPLTTIRLREGRLPAGMAGCASGDHLVLSPAYADLHSLRSRRVVAHELTHILQQRRGDVAGAGLVVDPALEAEAEAAAACVGRAAPLPDALRRRLTQPSGAAPNIGVVQPRIIIEAGPGEGIYDTSRAALLFDAVAVLINGPYNGRAVTVRDEPVMNYLRSADYYRFASMDGLAQYMVQARLNVKKAVEDADVPAPAANSPTPSLIYGAAHGDLHFGGKPTKEKAKWALSKKDACDAMEKEIAKHIGRIWRQTPLRGVAGVWYVAGPYQKCGRYQDGSKEGGLTDTFTIQAQVFIFENEVHYHGYPDEQIHHHGCGMVRNGVNDNETVDPAPGARRISGASVQENLEHLAELLGKK